MTRTPKPEPLEDTLAHLIDAWGVADVLSGLQLACGERAAALEHSAIMNHKAGEAWDVLAEAIATVRAQWIEHSGED